MPKGNSMKKTTLFIFSILLFSAISYSMEMPQRELANDASSSSQFMQGQQSFVGSQEEEFSWQEELMNCVSGTLLGASLASMVIGIISHHPSFTIGGAIALPLAGWGLAAIKLRDERRKRELEKEQ